MKKRLILLLSLCVLLFSNCDKDNTEHENILLTKTWKRGLIDKNPKSNPLEKIIYYPVRECEKDDTFKFNSNNTLTINKGLDKCNPTESSSETIKYSYDNLKNELIMDGTKYTVTEESNGQIKYFAPLSPATGFAYFVYILE